MFIAIENISKNDIICFSDSVVTALKTQESFLQSSGIIENAVKDYKIGDQVKPSQIPPNPILTEAGNIKKLSSILHDSTSINQKIITSLIIKKLAALKVLSGI